MPTVSSPPLRGPADTTEIVLPGRTPEEAARVVVEGAPHVWPQWMHWPLTCFTCPALRRRMNMDEAGRELSREERSSATCEYLDGCK